MIDLYRIIQRGPNTSHYSDYDHKHLNDYYYSVKGSQKVSVSSDQENILVLTEQENYFQH